MNITAFHTSLALAIGSALVMAACGGGGSSAAGSATSGTPASGSTTTASAINSANLKDVGAQIYSASQSLNNQVNSSTALVTGVSTSASGSGLLDTALQQLYFALQHQPASLAVGVVTSQTIGCSGGGSAVISANFASTTSTSAGDSLTVNANNCVEGLIRIHGSMNVVFNSVTGTPSATSAWTASLGITFTNFTVTANTVTSIANGDLALAFNQSGANNASFIGSGNSLQVHTVYGASITDYTLSSYNYSGTVTPPNLYTYRTNFTLGGNFPRLGNATYVIQTTTDFKQQRGANPSQGAMTVTASDNSSLRFTVVDTTNVQLGVDRNGDNTVDDTITTSWSELNSLF